MSLLGVVFLLVVVEEEMVMEVMLVACDRGSGGCNRRRGILGEIKVTRTQIGGVCLGGVC